jgi:CubicO group peptidase (beta-lactamase class C family)
VPYRSADFARWRREPVLGQVGDGNAFHAFGGVSGHAGLFSTVPDLLRYATALSRYEDYDRLWRPEVVREFFTPGPDPGQALGFRTYELPLRGETVTVLGHPGYVGCAVGFVPGRDIAIALAANRLLVDGTPTPTDALWTGLLRAITHRSRTV